MGWQTDVDVLVGQTIVPAVALASGSVGMAALAATGVVAFSACAFSSHHAGADARAAWLIPWLLCLLAVSLVLVASRTTAAAAAVIVAMALAAVACTRLLGSSGMKPRATGEGAATHEKNNASRIAVPRTVAFVSPLLAAAAAGWWGFVGLVLSLPPQPEWGALGFGPGEAYPLAVAGPVVLALWCSAQRVRWWAVASVCAMRWAVACWAARGVPAGPYKSRFLQVYGVQALIGGAAAALSALWVPSEPEQHVETPLWLCVCTLLAGTALLAACLLPALMVPMNGDHERPHHHLSLSPWTELRVITRPTAVALPNLDLSSVFYAATLGVIAGVEYPVLWRCLGVEPFSYVVAHLFTGVDAGTAAINIATCAWWVTVILALVVLVPHHGGDMVGNLALRKWYHLGAVAMFLPPLAVMPLAPTAVSPLPLVPLAFAVAVKALVIVELARAARVRPRWLSDAIHVGMTRNVDSRDTTAILIRTHLYLLAGCALPVWLEACQPALQWANPAGHAASAASGTHDQLAAPTGAVPPISRPPDRIAAMAGVLALGLGDAAAAVVGIVTRRRWGWGGGLPWEGGRKSIQGSVAYAAAVVAGACAAWSITPSSDAASHPSWLWAAVGMGVVGAVLESVVGGVDNLALPLVSWLVAVAVRRWW